MNNKELIRKLYFYILVIVQLLILTIYVYQYREEKIFIDIPYTSLIGTTIPDERGGWYVDETFPLEQTGIFDYTSDIELKKGTYDITISYETDTDYNFSRTTAKTKGYLGLLSDDVLLSQKLNETTFTVYLFENVESFRVENYFSGSGYLIIKNIRIVETRAFLRIKMFLLLTISIIIDVLYIARKHKWFQNIEHEKKQIAFLIIIGAVFASFPIFDQNLMVSQDIGFHLTRIEGIKDGLLNGQFPVKMQSNWMYGYGYPVSVYYADLFLYFPAFLRLVGFSVQTCYKVYILLTNLGTLYIAYWCCSHLSGNNKLAYIVSLLYTIAPYRLKDMYDRNAMGETLAIMFLPLIIYGIYSVITSDKEEKNFERKWVPLVIGFTGVIESHLLSCEMIAFFVILLCLLNFRTVFEKERFIVLFKTVLYTSLINAGFIFPCITSMKGIDVTQPYRTIIRIQSCGAELSELFSLFYTSMNRALGTGLALGIGLVTFLLVYYRGGKHTYNKMDYCLFGACVLAIFMSTRYFPWDYLSSILGDHNLLIGNIQFPYRFLGLANVFLMFIMIISLGRCAKFCNTSVVLSIALCILVIGIVGSDFVIRDRMDGEQRTVYDIDAFGRADFNVKEYLLYGTDIKQLMPNSINVENGVSYSEYYRDGDELSIRCENSSDDIKYIELPVLFYEQYVAKDEYGKSLDLSCGNNNVIRIELPGYFVGNIVVRYVQPISWRIMEIISLFSAVSLFFTILIKKRKQQCKNSNV